MQLLQSASQRARPIGGGRIKVIIFHDIRLHASGRGRLQILYLLQSVCLCVCMQYTHVDIQSTTRQKAAVCPLFTPGHLFLLPAFCPNLEDKTAVSR